MAINWPSPAVNGDTYEFAGVTYTFLQSGSDEGYWTVISVSDVAQASSETITEGTDNVQFITSEGLAGSSYKATQELQSIKPTVEMLTNNKLINTLKGAMTFAREGSSTVVNQSSAIETVDTDVPAFGIDGLACFESVTNAAIYSEDFSQWTLTGSPTPTITGSQSDPSGNTNATKVDTSGTNAGLLISTVQLGVRYNTSVWLKGEVGGEVVSFGSGGADLQQVTLTTYWNRYSIYNQTSVDNNFRILASVGQAQSFYVYGAQATLTSYLAPYIPTQDTPDTRAADRTTIPMLGNLPASGEAFTIMCDASVPDDGVSEHDIWGTNFYYPDTGVTFVLRRVSSGTIFFNYDDSDGTTMGVSAIGVDTNVHRFTCTYDGISTTKLYVDGELMNQKTTNGLKDLSAYSDIVLGDWGSDRTLNSYIKNFKIYNKALSDSQVASLGGAE